MCPSTDWLPPLTLTSFGFLLIRVRLWHPFHSLPSISSTQLILVPDQSCLYVTFKQITNTLDGHQQDIARVVVHFSYLSKQGNKVEEPIFTCSVCKFNFVRLDGAENVVMG